MRTSRWVQAFRTFTSYHGKRKKTLEDLALDIDLAARNVLVRVDLDMPRDEVDDTVLDETKARAIAPTVEFLLKKKAKVLLLSHYGQPRGEVTESMRMDAAGPVLCTALDYTISGPQECVGEKVEGLARKSRSTVIMLENVRFHKGEEDNDPVFAEQLSRVADIYVNDALGVSHVAHASTVGVTNFMDHKVAGLLMQKELTYLQAALDKPTRPLLAIVGGAKLSHKVTVMKSLLDKCDRMVVGGGMIFTFYQALGFDVGSSLVQEDYVDTARDLLEKASAKGVKILLPLDVVVAEKLAADATSKVVSATAIPESWMGLDIGPKAIANITREIAAAQTIFWYGPLGVYEWESFANGTSEVAYAMAARSNEGATTIIAGDDCVAAVKQTGVAENMTHVSEAGEGAVAVLEGKELPGWEALDDA